MSAIRLLLDAGDVSVGNHSKCPVIGELLGWCPVSFVETTKFEVFLLLAYEWIGHTSLQLPKELWALWNHSCLLDPDLSSGEWTFSGDENLGPTELSQRLRPLRIDPWLTQESINQAGRLYVCRSHLYILQDKQCKNWREAMACILWGWYQKASYLSSI